MFCVFCQKTWKINSSLGDWEPLFVIWGNCWKGGSCPPLTFLGGSLRCCSGFNYWCSWGQRSFTCQVFFKIWCVSCQRRLRNPLHAPAALLHVVAAFWVVAERQPLPAGFCSLVPSSIWEWSLLPSLSFSRLDALGLIQPHNDSRGINHTMGMMSSLYVL